MFFLELNLFIQVEYVTWILDWYLKQVRLLKQFVSIFLYYVFVLE